MVFIRDHLENKEWAEECKCRREKILLSRLKKANIPEEFSSLTISSFRIDVYETKEHQERAARAKRVAANYVRKFHNPEVKGKGLYLYSYTKGSGKTRLMASILNALTKQYEVLTLFMKADELLNEIRRTFNPESKVNTSQLIQQIKDVDVLAIDDIGVEKVSDWVEETLTSILDYRMTNHKPTLFTSNLSVDELDHRYAQGRVKSRIERMTFPVYMPDESIRSLLAKKENEKLQELFYE
jgi:DNA replication protein DnaC